MPTYLPVDSNNNPIPAMRFKTDGAHSISATSTSARNSTSFASNTRVISVYATGPVYIKFGDSSVTASSSDHYFPEGVYYDIAIGGDNVGQFTHVAVLRVTDDCNVYISEKE